MSSSRVADEKMPKRANSRQRAFRERQLRNLRRQALIALENPNNSSSINRPKKKPIIVTIYER